MWEKHNCDSVIMQTGLAQKLYLVNLIKNTHTETHVGIHTSLYTHIHTHTFTHSIQTLTVECLLKTRPMYFTLDFPYIVAHCFVLSTVPGFTMLASCTPTTTCFVDWTGSWKQYGSILCPGADWKRELCPLLDRQGYCQQYRPWIE